MFYYFFDVLGKEEVRTQADRLVVFVVSQIDAEEKEEIGLLTSLPLLRKVVEVSFELSLHPFLFGSSSF